MRKLTAFVIAAMLALPMAAFANDMKFDDIDTNKDGYISKDEANAHHDAMFSKKDTNGDGKISKEEFDAYHKEHKGKWFGKDKDKSK